MRARAAMAALMLSPAAMAEPGLVIDMEIEPYGFFDYLGEMVEDEDGEWLDPLAMETLGDDGQGENDDEDGMPERAAEEDDDE